MAEGKIRAVVQQDDPPYRLTKNDRCFESLKFSPSKRFGAELKYFERHVLAKKHIPGPQVMIKVVDFAKKKYFYNFPLVSSIAGLYVISHSLFWLSEDCVLLVFCDLSVICFQKYCVDHSKMSITRTWEKFVSTHVGYRMNIMSEVFRQNGKTFVVVKELGKKEFCLYSCDEEVEESILSFPSKITKADATYIVAKDEMILASGYVFLNASKEQPVKGGKRERSQKMAIRVKMTDVDLKNTKWMYNLGASRFDLSSYPVDDMHLVTYNEQYLVYEVNEESDTTYYALDIRSLTWSTLEVSDNLHDFAVLRGNALMLFHQEMTPGQPAKFSALSYHTLEKFTCIDKINK